jgi:hypothetical protein
MSCERPVAYISRPGQQGPGSPRAVGLRRLSQHGFAQLRQISHMDTPSTIGPWPCSSLLPEGGRQAAKVGSTSARKLPSTSRPLEARHLGEGAKSLDQGASVLPGRRAQCSLRPDRHLGRAEGQCGSEFTQRHQTRLVAARHDQRRAAARRDDGGVGAELGRRRVHHDMVELASARASAAPKAGRSMSSSGLGGGDADGQHEEAGQALGHHWMTLPLGAAGQDVGQPGSWLTTEDFVLARRCAGRHPPAACAAHLRQATARLAASSSCRRRAVGADHGHGRRGWPSVSGWRISTGCAARGRPRPAR